MSNEALLDPAYLIPFPASDNPLEQASSSVPTIRIGHMYLYGTHWGLCQTTSKSESASMPNCTPRQKRERQEESDCEKRWLILRMNSEGLALR